MEKFTEKQPIPRYRIGDQVIVSQSVVFITKVFAVVDSFDKETNTQTLRWLYRGIFVLPPYKQQDSDDMVHDFSETDIYGVMPLRSQLNKMEEGDCFGERTWRKFIPEAYIDGTDNTHLNPITHE